MARLDNYSRFEDKAPELLVSLAVQVEKSLQEKLALDSDEAKQLGIEISQRFAEDWGGITVYIPKYLASLLNERDYKIWQEFNGRNHAELARKYKVSMQWIYKIIERMQKAEMDRIQPDLFPK